MKRKLGQIVDPIHHPQTRFIISSRVLRFDLAIVFIAISHNCVALVVCFPSTRVQETIFTPGDVANHLFLHPFVSASTMGSIPASPGYGHRLLPVVIDDAARIEPDRVLFYTPRNNQPSQGYEVVTARTFANSINRLCWWLESQLGSHKESKTIGYIGQSMFLSFFTLIYSSYLCFL